MNKEYYKMTKIQIDGLKTQNLNHNWEYNVNNVCDNYKNFKAYYKAITKEFLTNITKELNKELKNNKLDIKAKYTHDKEFINDIIIEFYSSDKYNYENLELINSLDKIIRYFREKMYIKRENNEIDFIIVI